MLTTNVAVLLAALFFQSSAPSTTKAGPAKPLIDNERVTVWDTATPRAYAHEFIAIQLADGAVWSGKAGGTPASHGRTVVIELKDNSIPPIANTSGFPNAFPRPGSKKVLESKRVIVWDYNWTTGLPTPMHFHDKDVVVTYLKDGSLKSTTPSGAVTVNDYKFADVRYNLRNRSHTETLVKGSQRAIIVEFK